MSADSQKGGMSPLMRGIICVAIGAIIWFIPVPEGVKPIAWRLLAVFVATIAGFILKPLPLGAIALITCALLPPLGIMKAGQALEGFANTTIWLIVAAFMFAAAFIKTGLGTRIAYFLLLKFGKSSLSVAYVMCATDFVIAPFTPSNTARGGGIIFPIVNSICNTLGADPKSGKLVRTGAFLMFTSYAAVITSACIFLTGASNNVLCNTLAEQMFGTSISWSSWFLACIVPGLLLTIVTPALLYKMINPEIKAMPETQALAKKKLGEMGSMSGHEKILVVVFLTCLVLWATSSMHGIAAAIVALLGLAAMLVTKCLDWDDILGQKGAWDVMIWMGVLVNMAAYLSKYGLMSWFAALMAEKCAGMSWMMMFIILAIVYTYAHYFLASNSAHIAAMFGAFATIMVAAGAPTLAVLIMFGALCNSASFLTHYGCGVTPIFFGAGFMGQGEWWKIGFVLTALHIIVWLGLGLPWMGILGML